MIVYNKIRANLSREDNACEDNTPATTAIMALTSTEDKGPVAIQRLWCVGFVRELLVSKQNETAKHTCCTRRGSGSGDQEACPTLPRGLVASRYQVGVSNRLPCGLQPSWGVKLIKYLLKRSLRLDSEYLVNCRLCLLNCGVIS